MLTLTNKDIREYRVQDLLYHFVLFHHIPSIRSIMYMPILGGGEPDNAILAYCYSDRRAGLSYKAICCAKLSDDGTVEYHTDELPPRSLTIREGGLECPAEVIDEDDEDMEQFRKVADSVRKHYGYHKELIEDREDTMDRESIEKIKNSVKSVIDLIDLMENLRLEYGSEQQVDDTTKKRLSDNAKMEMLFLIFMLVDRKRELISRESLWYINECLNSQPDPEDLAKLWKAFFIEDSFELNSVTLTLFIMFDIQRGGNGYSMTYVGILSDYLLGYLKIIGKNTPEKLVKYYRLIEKYVELVENALGTKVDFDPLSSIDQDIAETVRSQAEAERKKPGGDPNITLVDAAIQVEKEKSENRVFNFGSIL